VALRAKLELLDRLNRKTARLTRQLPSQKKPVSGHSNNLDAPIDPHAWNLVKF